MPAKHSSGTSHLYSVLPASNMTAVVAKKNLHGQNAVAFAQVPNAASPAAISDTSALSYTIALRYSKNVADNARDVPITRE
jgi:hypothetical protein